MSRIILLGIVVFVAACAPKPRTNSSLSLEQADLNFKLLPDTKYKIVQEQSSTMGGSPMSTKAEFLIWVKDLSNVEVSVIDFQQDITDEEQRKMVENMLAKMDFSSFDTNVCHALNGKTLESEYSKNKNANPRTSGAIQAWNMQYDLPERKMNIGDSYEVENTNRRKTSKTVTKYSLDKVEDHIAYLSFEEFTRYDRSEESKKMSASGKLNAQGKLEYDLTQNFYRFYTKDESASFNLNFDSPDEERMKSVDEAFDVENNITIHISIE